MTRMPQRARIEAAFNAFCAAELHDVYRWTPGIIAERWARFAHECVVMFAASGVPERFRDVDLDYLTERWLPEGYRKLGVVLMRQIDDPGLMAINGERGCGKTALACGLVRAFCHLGRPALYLRAHDLFDRLGAADWKDKDRVRADLRRPALLVIDEVQQRDEARQWQDNELTTLIDHRYADRKATVLLSNLTHAAFAENLGASIMRRLVEECGIYETTWPTIQQLQAAHEQANRPAPKRPAPPSPPPPVPTDSTSGQQIAQR
jgi:hypothetical protein